MAAPSRWPEAELVRVYGDSSAAIRFNRIGDSECSHFGEPQAFEPPAPDYGMRGRDIGARWNDGGDAMPTIRLKAGDELALADGERSALERHHLAVATDDIAQLKHASFLPPNKRLERDA